MLYMVIHAVIYMLHGGRLWPFILTTLGYDVEEDKTPPLPAAGEEIQPTEDTTAGDEGEGDTGETALNKGHGDVVGSQVETPLLSSGGVGTVSGGTFSSRFETLAEDIEDGVATFKSKVSDRVSSGEHEFAAKMATGVVGGAKKVAADHGWSKEKIQALKRRIVSSGLTPLVVLSSLVSDIDHVTNWWYLQFGMGAEGHIIRRVALTFAIIGSIMWILSATDFALVSKVKEFWASDPASRLENAGPGWQFLANTVLEGLPQVAITMLTGPTSGAGVLNLSTSTTALLAKVAHGLSKDRGPSLSTQLEMIDEDPSATQNMLTFRDEAKKNAAKGKSLIRLAWTHRRSLGQSKAVVAFKIFQQDSTFLKGRLGHIKEDLLRSSKLAIADRCLKGPIPPQIGNMTSLLTIILSGDELSGAIPAELGKIRCLQKLDLSGNDLSGEIPLALCNLSSLQELDLSHNKLTGLVPKELGNLTNLRIISVASNFLSGVEESQAAIKLQLHPECRTDFLPQFEEEIA